MISYQQSFSALQRAENSSIHIDTVHPLPGRSFSALQRAENSSIRPRARRSRSAREFQCSSASRKFLNKTRIRSFPEHPDVSVLFSEPKIPQSPSPSERCTSIPPSFSALQRAENSSIEPEAARLVQLPEFQCSSASRKFLNTNVAVNDVLKMTFQCSSASRKFLNCGATIRCIAPAVFQCSSASRKFLNPDPRTCVHPYFRPR